MKATLVAKRKEMLPSGVTVEIAIWRLPAPTPDRPHERLCGTTMNAAKATIATNAGANFRIVSRPLPG
jgi:hypothetical protein